MIYGFGIGNVSRYQTGFYCVLDALKSYTIWDISVLTEFRTLLVTWNDCHQIEWSWNSAYGCLQKLSSCGGQALLIHKITMLELSFYNI